MRIQEIIVLQGFTNLTTTRFENEVHLTHAVHSFKLSRYRLSIKLSRLKILYLRENRTAEEVIKVMSKTDKAMRIREKLLRNWISLLLRTRIDRPLPRRPIRTVKGVTITSIK